MKGQTTLAEIRGLTARLTVACSRCPRREDFMIGDLIDKFGDSLALPTLTRLVSVGCAHQDAHNLRDRCDVHFPGLAALMGVKV